MTGQLQLFPNDWKTFAMSISRKQLDDLRDCGQDDIYYVLTEIRKLTRMAEASNRQFERRIETVLRYLD